MLGPHCPRQGGSLMWPSTKDWRAAGQKVQNSGSSNFIPTRCVVRHCIVTCRLQSFHPTYYPHGTLAATFTWTVGASPKYPAKFLTIAKVVQHADPQSQIVVWWQLPKILDLISTRTFLNLSLDLIWRILSYQGLVQLESLGISLPDGIEMRGA